MTAHVTGNGTARVTGKKTYKDHDLPPGWCIGKDKDGQIRIIDEQGVGLPMVANEHVGTEKQRASLARLKAWKEKHAKRSS